MTVRVPIEGTVIGVSKRSIPEGGTRWQMVVLTKQGFRVAGVIPKQFRPGFEWTGEDYVPCGVARLSYVKFVAEVIWSKDDHTFGGFRRPSKFELVSR